MGVVPQVKGFEVAKKLCVILSVNVSVQNGLNEVRNLSTENTWLSRITHSGTSLVVQW